MGNLDGVDLKLCALPNFGGGRAAPRAPKKLDSWQLLFALTGFAKYGNWNDHNLKLGSFQHGVLSHEFETVGQSIPMHTR